MNPKAKTIARIFVNQIVPRHSIPLELHTDQGRNFESKIFQEMCLSELKKQEQLPYILNLTVRLSASIARSFIIYSNIFRKIRKMG